MRCLTVLLVALWLALPGVVAAQTSSPIEQSRVHHQKAVVHFNLDEWKQAAEEFKEAYRLHPDPLFLYNIAQCYRKLGEHESALSFYRKYSRAVPNASNRAEVKRRITELEALLAASSKAREAPPATVIAPSGEAPPPAPVSPPPAAAAPTAALAPAPLPAAPPPVAASEPVGGLVQTAPPPDESPPVYKRWWFWAGVGALVAAGVVVGIVASAPGTREPYQGDLGPGRITVPR